VASGRGVRDGRVGAAARGRKPPIAAPGAGTAEWPGVAREALAGTAEWPGVAREALAGTAEWPGVARGALAGTAETGGMGAPAGGRTPFGRNAAPPQP
jgi:hypothetical protein